MNCWSLDSLSIGKLIPTRGLLMTRSPLKLETYRNQKLFECLFLLQVESHFRSILYTFKMIFLSEIVDIADVN
ncbi:hypothetical protein DPEC_G00067510 [Dallia pectoralis]|uniref:Uncharacterized protein n=1 Tax=Dallia pectoralis TaxID=75939 RepID=A0ACC2H967_DALPE|nr:hypothetical protein DPEC_G00067510 [Dallia pectoralis]